MAHILHPLPFGLTALEPHMSADTLTFHHSAHHRGYINKLNGLVQGTPLENLTLEETMDMAAAGKIPTRTEDETRNIFNNAAQAWNHEFFWHSLSPPHEKEAGWAGPNEHLEHLIVATYGSIDGFKNAFHDQALGLFGSGWVWLVYHDGQVAVETTANAGTPIVHGRWPLLCCDLWEHAYYLDYQNKRGAFVTAFLDHLANWRFAEQNLEAAEGMDRPTPRPGGRQYSGPSPGLGRRL